MILGFPGMKKKARNKKNRMDDTNVEWYGPDVGLKKKNYGELKDDFRDKILTDTEIQQEREFKRINNINNKD